MILVLDQGVHIQSKHLHSMSTQKQDQKQGSSRASFSFSPMRNRAEFSRFVRFHTESTSSSPLRSLKKGNGPP